MSLFVSSDVLQTLHLRNLSGWKVEPAVRSHLQRAHARLKPILHLLLCDAYICLTLCLGIQIVCLGWALSYMFNPSFFAFLQGLAREQEVNGVSCRDAL